MEHKNETAQARALRLLEEIYEQTVNNIGKPVFATKLAATIESTEQEAMASWQYLRERNLINTHGVSGSPGPATVNANGIDTIEKAKEQPTQPPPGFGSVTYNTIHIHRMEGGAIAQAGAHSTQHQTIYNSKDFDDLWQAIEILAQRIDELNLDAAAKKKALTQVNTIKVQLGDDEPSSNIIREAGRTLRNITEGAISELIAKGVIDYWPVVLGVLTRMFGGAS